MIIGGEHDKLDTPCGCAGQNVDIPDVAGAQIWQCADDCPVGAEREAACRELTVSMVVADARRGHRCR